MLGRCLVSLWRPAWHKAGVMRMLAVNWSLERENKGIGVHGWVVCWG